MEITEKVWKKFFEDLAERTRNVSEVEKNIIISEVKIDERPSFHMYDIAGNGLYLLHGKKLGWHEYAEAFLKKVESNKNTSLYT